MHVAPSRETSRTATVVLGGCRSASVTSGASSLGAHAGGNRNRGGAAGGSESIIAESQVAYGAGCKAVDNGCGSCRGIGEVTVRTDTTCKNTNTTRGQDTRALIRSQQALSHACAWVAFFLATKSQSTIPTVSQVLRLVLPREVAQEDQVGRQRHHHVQSCLKHAGGARRGLWASGEDHLCDDLGH